MFREMSQTPKGKYRVISYIWNKVELTKAENRIVIARGWREGEIWGDWSKGTHFQLEDK